MTLKNNLIRLMKAKKIKIKELACLAKISEPTLKRLRSKQCNPTLDVLVKLSHALRVGIDELIQDSYICHQDLDPPIDMPEKNGDSKLRPLNKSGLSVIDIETFTLILKEIVTALNQQYLHIDCQEIVDFCYDIYNNIITTSTDAAGKITMIKLAISSLKRGNLLKQDQEERAYKTV